MPYIRKINVCLKKREFPPDISQIENEITNKIKDLCFSEDFVRVILETLLKHSGNDNTEKLIQLCLDTIMTEVDNITEPPVKWYKEKFKILNVFYEKKRCFVQYCYQDGKDWWTDWREAKDYQWAEREDLEVFQ